MAVDLSNVLVIGVSSRALFDLEKENEVFRKQGIDAYSKYQLDNEDVLLEPGTAYPLIKNLLDLNKYSEKPLVEVIVMSKNSPDTGVRMLNSIQEHKLDITRIALSGGEPLYPYIKAYDIDLFLSKEEEDVQAVIDEGVSAAALLYPPPSEYSSLDSRVKIAFDADAVLFSEESELRYKQHGMAAFHKYESEHKDEPLKEGPFTKLLIKLSNIQNHIRENGISPSPLRLAIVTARNAPSHMRVINTLREWNVYVDEAFFLGGLAKDNVLRAFGAQIFFDDQDTHLKSSSIVVPSGRVPYKSNSELKSYLDLIELKEKEGTFVAEPEIPADAFMDNEA